MRQLSGSTLLIGYGNPGRLDDGLGPLLVEQLRESGISRLTVESSYQLAVEHAEQASGFDVVIFADASINGAEPFQWAPVKPQTTIAFSTHHVSPETILGLAQGVFGSDVEGFTLAIRGYAFDDFGERLSSQAEANLAAALESVQSLFRRTSSQTLERPAIGQGIE